ncbi:asparagine synthase (glutamine-hydrolyzing) [Caldithrix abyssi DSM 13497]|uniref:asparagine synthase (glutamine-hydrolyzing) n=1 Tax=Caldithrix abyssi DSM 13497 TaxID=880073 RepID=H1XS48_CALAY|nr:asparagine synthase (glutamine-hydrolyzing) [Caldithrix abyssi]APF20151.1 asparagine synthase (glutamine-hydrolysing) [Caldithrix abyssi DSM 13497]EHO40212.1 asparagine synthase (glutamine-hydrolyzing) [Caldithrix abyssi DSM 13497]
MCGIFGYIANKKLNDEKIIELLSKRGPDNNSIIDISDSKKIKKLFHTRLAIIDLNERANQPYFDKSGRYVITYNGEIYNFKNIKEELINKGYIFSTTSDTEVVLYSFIEWGEKALLKLRGMFSFGIYDKQNDSWFLARDPFGIKPLYYYYDRNSFVFSSLVMPIVYSGIKEKFTINTAAISDYLATGSFIPPDTIFNEINFLKPGHYLLYKNDSIKINKYFSERNNGKLESFNNYNEVLQRVRSVIIDSIDKHFVSDVPVGVLLSSGIDSSLIAGISAILLGKKINTYSIGYYNKKKYRKIDETAIASKTAKYIQSKHENILIDYSEFDNMYDEFLESIDLPSIDGFNTFIISKKIAQRVKVVLSGLGGDEMFAGYSIFKDLYFAHQESKFIDELLMKLPYKIQSILKKDYLKYRGKDINNALIKRRILSVLKNSTRNKLIRMIVETDDVIKLISNYEIRHYMSNTLLRDSDAVSMAQGLEMRVPFVDIKIYDLINNIPAHYKISKKYNKRLLVDAFKDILLEDVYKTQKRGFSLPIPQWARNYLVNNWDIYSLYNKDILHSLGVDVNLFNNEFFNNNKIDYNYYKWLVLLIWLKKHNNYIYFQ